MAAFHLFSNARIVADTISGLSCAAAESKAHTASDAATKSKTLIFMS
jgi:hypothetical protein